MSAKPHYCRFNYNNPVRKFPILTTERDADLIETTIHNPSKGSSILYMLQVDLDLDKVRNPKFLIQDKDVDGGKRISWDKVKGYLEQNHPYLLDHIFAATRSYSLKGLCVAFSISPLALGAKKTSSERAARALLAKIHDAFDKAGCGLDRGAIGLKRLCANWQNEEKREYFRPDIKKKTESERTPVISLLLRKMNKDPLLAYKRKKDQEKTLLWTESIRTEKKLAQLFVELLDNDNTLQISVEELHKLTKISKPTLFKVLNNPPRWLSAENMGKFEGWSLTLKNEFDYSGRVNELLDPSSTPRTNPANDFSVEPCKRPEEILKGDRNRQLTNWFLRLKWFGVEFNEAYNHVLKLSEGIPEKTNSRNCKNTAILNKARSIYYSPLHNTFGICPANQDFPEWLRPQKSYASMVSENDKKLLEAPLGAIAFTGDHISFPEIYDEASFRTVGIDNHFKWKAKKRKNKKGKDYWQYSYFSVPSAEIGLKKVFVVKKSNKLLVFTVDKKRFICQHEYTNVPHSYITIEEHMINFDARSYLKWLQRTYSFGRSVFTSWDILIELKGFKALREIQHAARQLNSMAAIS